MRKQKLTDVPDNILVKPEAVKRNNKWQSEYNIAAWFRFESVTLTPIKLHIVWKDDAGDQSMCVDQTVINSASLLLSGIARLKVTGKMKAMSVVVETDDSGYTVDELFVQPTRTNTNKKQAL